MSWYYPKRSGKSSANGIRLRKDAEKGATWWSKQWISSVTSFSNKKRLEMGLRYAKSGQVLSIRIDQGFAEAEVQGSRTRPYKVEIGLPMFTRKQWARVTDALLQKALFTAKLLAGDLPQELELLFRKAGAPLFPTSQDDISTDCSCPDLESPCKHVAATYYLLAQEIEGDPFILMAMRGFNRAQLLAEIQTRRSLKGKPAGLTPAVTATAFKGPLRTALAANLHDFFQSPKSQSLTWPVDPDYLANLPLPAARIHEMGAPPFWQSDNDFEDVLKRVYQAVRKRALG